MANPQQSEREPFGPVPDANLPGHHDEHDQDRPDLDAFAERFGIVSTQHEGSSARGTDEQVVEATRPEREVATAGRRGGAPQTDFSIAHLRQAPPRVAATATVVRIGSRVMLGPWIIAGRLAETALDAVDRRYVRAAPPRQLHPERHSGRG